MGMANDKRKMKYQTYRSLHDAFLE